MTIEQIAETIIEMTGSTSQIVYQPLPDDDPKVRQPDITRARTLLGWEPKVDLREGLTQDDRLLQDQGAVASAGAGAASPRPVDRRSRGMPIVDSGAGTRRGLSRGSPQVLTLGHGAQR